MSDSFTGRAQDAALRARLRALPKVELHRHFEGAFRLETLWDFHSACDEDAHADYESFVRAATVPPESSPGFLPFLSCFNALRFQFGAHDAIERLAREAVRDAARDGVVHLEIRFSPIFLARRMRREVRGGTGLATVVDAPPPAVEVEAAAETVVRAARDEARTQGIGVGFIMTLARHFGVEGNRRAAELLDRPVGEAFAALDIAGDESLPLNSMDPLVEPWRAAGKALTIHAGEAGGPGNVREAVCAYGAARIGHGVRVIDDPSMVAELARRGVPLEMCPTSNVQTQAAASWESYPLRALRAAGVQVTLNTDDPTISGIDLTEEYARAHERLGLSLAELGAVAAAGARAAFLPAADRDALAARIEKAWVAC